MMETVLSRVFGVRRSELLDLAKSRAFATVVKPETRKTFDGRVPGLDSPVGSGAAAARMKMNAAVKRANAALTPARAAMRKRLEQGYAMHGEEEMSAPPPIEDVSGVLAPKAAGTTSSRGRASRRRSDRRMRSRSVSESDPSALDDTGTAAAAHEWLIPDSGRPSTSGSGAGTRGLDLAATAPSRRRSTSATPAATPSSTAALDATDAVSSARAQRLTSPVPSRVRRVAGGGRRRSSVEIMAEINSQLQSPSGLSRQRSHQRLMATTMPARRPATASVRSSVAPVGGETRRPQTASASRRTGARGSVASRGRVGAGSRAGSPLPALSQTMDARPATAGAGRRWSGATSGRGTAGSTGSTGRT